MEQMIKWREFEKSRISDKILQCQKQIEIHEDEIKKLQAKIVARNEKAKDEQERQDKIADMKAEIKAYWLFLWWGCSLFYYDGYFCPLSW